jgi:serine protease Do
VAIPPPKAEAVASAPAQTDELSPEALYAKVAPSVVVVVSMDANGRPFAHGSGVVTDTQQVVTNCHVIQRAVQIKVRSGGVEYTAASGTSDTYFDLCMLQVANLPAAAIPRSSVSKLRVGQTVYAVGAPQGFDQTLSQGLVSALREMPVGMVIQTSAAISPGSSGGGLFDSHGRLVGITTFQAKAGQNLNFALPADWLDTMRTR